MLKNNRKQFRKNLKNWLDDNQKSVVQKKDPHCRSQETMFISEAGLYKMIMRGNNAIKPGTPQHSFCNFVCANVLPALRKTGRYDISEHPEHVALLNAKNDVEQVLVNTIKEKKLQKQQHARRGREQWKISNQLIEKTAKTQN